MHLFHSVRAQRKQLYGSTRFPDVREAAPSILHLIHPVLPVAGIHRNQWLTEPPSPSSDSPRYGIEPTPVIYSLNSATRIPLTSRGTKMAERGKRGPTAWPCGINTSPPLYQFRCLPRPPKKRREGCQKLSSDLYKSIQEHPYKSFPTSFHLCKLQHVLVF